MDLFIESRRERKMTETSCRLLLKIRLQPFIYRDFTFCAWKYQICISVIMFFCIELWKYSCRQMKLKLGLMVVFFTTLCVLEDWEKCFNLFLWKYLKYRFIYLFILFLACSAVAAGILVIKAILPELCPSQRESLDLLESPRNSGMTKACWRRLLCI